MIRMTKREIKEKKERKLFVNREIDRIRTLHHAIRNAMDSLSDLNLAFIQLLTKLGYELQEDGTITKKVDK